MHVKVAVFVYALCACVYVSGRVYRLLFSCVRSVHVSVRVWKFVHVSVSLCTPIARECTRLDVCARACKGSF